MTTPPPSVYMLCRRCRTPLYKGPPARFHRIGCPRCGAVNQVDWAIVPSAQRPLPDAMPQNTGDMSSIPVNPPVVDGGPHP